MYFSIASSTLSAVNFSLRPQANRNLKYFIRLSWWAGAVVMIIGCDVGVARTDAVWQRAQFGPTISTGPIWRREKPIGVSMPGSWMTPRLA